MGVRVVLATKDQWPMIGDVFGARATNPNSCWCQRFRRHHATDNRTALREELESSETPVGLLAFDGYDPIGWTRVVPRATLPGISGNSALARVLENDPRAWWVACFVVRRDHRGEGVGVELLQGAISWAAEHQATVLDGHPVDTAAMTTTPSPSAVFTGTLRMFERAGFVEVGRTYPTRPVMRYPIAAR